MGSIQEVLVSRFTWIDYTVFGLMLVLSPLSACIGVYYGCFAHKMKNTKEFLMAGKDMTTFPVAMSLIASFMSAIALLGTPSEVYQNGVSYSLIVLSYVVVMFASVYLYLPVFWDLQVTSAYEYLERRFNKSVRILGSLLFVTQMCFYMAVVVYAPALALAQMTGVNVRISVTLICFVCMFYTTLGGMKAVLWTDALQAVIIYGSILFIVIKGTLDVGGFARVWEVSSQGNRTDLFNFDPDFRTRHTFWSLFIGGYFVWVAIYGVNQAQVQRYLCVKEKSIAIRALWINCAGYVILILTCSFGGLMIYTKYVDCDPVSSKLVSKADQMLPYFVMDSLGKFKGLPGLFVAGIFSGALSTISSGMNSLAAITLEDIVRAINPKISEKVALATSKFLSLFYGILTFVLVFIAEEMGDIVSASLGIHGLIGGPILGVFSLGMFFPWANSFGAFIGTLLGLSLTLWIGIGYQIAFRTGGIVSTRLHMNTCNYTSNVLQEDIFRILPNSSVAETFADYDVSLNYSPLNEMYKMSYMWYSAVGCLSVIVFGLLLSFVTGRRNVKTLDPRLISPPVFWFKFLIPSLKNIGIHHESNQIPLMKLSNGTKMVDLSSKDSLAASL